MTDLSAFTALPPTAPVRVRWIEYPFCDRTGTGADDCRCPICEGKPRPILWEGVEPLWSPRTRQPSLSEQYAADQGWVKDGTVLAFVRDLLLVAGDDGRILTLPVETVRVLSDVKP